MMQETVLHTRGSGIPEPSDARDPGGVRAVVTACFEATAADQERVLKPLADRLPLLDSGLDSLCFAIIVAQLEDELGLDPFSELDDAFFPVTFGEFLQLYETAAARSAG